MTIANVTGGATITSTWGNSVKDAVNGLIDRMAVNVQRATQQSIPNNTSTKMQWNAEGFDVGGLHDNVTNNTRLTIPAGGGGLWSVGFRISWGGSSAGTKRSAVVLLNGGASPYLAGAEQTPLNFCLMGGGGIYRLSDGDYIEVSVLQDSGGALDVRGNNSVGNISAFWAYRLGD